MTKFKKNLLFLFYLLAGIVLGALVAYLCENVSFLSWLSFYVSFGTPGDGPLVLDLSVIRLTFGVSVGIYVAQIFTVGLALWIYNRARLK